jgi:hypothetical protein
MQTNDGTRPDGVTQLPWKNGKRLLWDVTCSDTFAPSYRQIALKGTSGVAIAAEKRKVQKYQHYTQNYIFQPVGVETLGAMGTGARDFIEEIGMKLTECTGEVRSTIFLKQRFSIEIQRGNAQSVIEGMPFAAGMLTELEFLN